MLDSGAVGPGFKSQPRRWQVLGKLFIPIVPLFTKQRNWVTAGLVESNGSRVYDSRHLQADCQNWDQLQNPTLSNRVWATFTFLVYILYD